MSNEYRNNHYVPVWYQKRFVSPRSVDNELFYLDLRPEAFTDSRGISHQRKPVRRQGPRRCFCETDLYTLRFPLVAATDVERLFFGEIDSKGRVAVDYFAGFQHGGPGPGKVFNDFIIYLTTQKLRTPKGFAWLADAVQTKDRDVLLNYMTYYRQLFGAIWTESVWSIADASSSETKFIVSDHPVTVYKRRCGPRSQWCRGHNDPDIIFNATHTLFPLSLTKLLILTNLSWVRNPYQNPVGSRPNPDLFRAGMFYVLGVQVGRMFTEKEVREVNFIIKSRARRYVAAGEEDWLYPEMHVSKSDWARFGYGYLLMPDPRSVSFSTGILLGFNDGNSTGYDAYRRRPGDRNYRREESNGPDEFYSLHKFRRDFARLFGPRRRGRAFEISGLGPEADSDYLHQANLRFGRRR